MSISQQIPDQIRRVSRSLGYALWLGTSDDWLGLSVILRARLAPEDRAALAMMALRSLDDDTARKAAEAAFCWGAGAPIVPLFSPVDEAANWASLASLNERKAYALAAYEALPKRDQMAFRKHISEVEISA